MGDMAYVLYVWQCQYDIALLALASLSECFKPEQMEPVYGMFLNDLQCES